MTPAEHYEQAEIYLAEAIAQMANPEATPAHIDYLLRVAQIHATLGTTP